MAASLANFLDPAEPAHAETTAQDYARSARSTVPAQNTTPQSSQFHDLRIALVIGESRYLNLPKLANPESDARSIAETLQKLGYDTQLLLDAPEDGIRKEIRKFASESGKAEVAVVFYAGHGAQLNGSNYLLPVDIDIPHTEADIQFAGLKVDDLINSIGSNTKIVFLDACRDNPALFKNLVTGRGSSPLGLAPASASNLSPAKPGGGVFIAYATDAGAVAADGHGEHSPFTQALLRNMQKPISIDDMFSLVTKEVRLVTKNAQRPFKYASLENIICLTPACSGTPAAVAADIVQQAAQSGDEELQIALQTKNSDALETYLQRYPETKKRDELLSEIAALKRSEFTEWTLFEVGGQRFPQYIQLGSIQHFGDRAAAKAKALVNPSLPKIFPGGKTLPDAAYYEDLNVYDCTEPTMAIAEDSVFDQTGNLLSHYKFADPRYLNLSIGMQLQPGSIGWTARNIVCHQETGTPLVSKSELAEMKFTSLASTVAGDGEIFFKLSQVSQEVQDQKAVILIIRNNADHNVTEFMAGVSIPDPPNFRTEVDRVLLKCSENKFAIEKVEMWNAANQLVRMGVLDPTRTIPYSDFKPFSAYATLQEIVRGKGYGGLGLRYSAEDGSIKVVEVFSGSPAEKLASKQMTS
jgi:uncharacterized caspase-like protein